jgi:hypothetical protein
MNAYMPLWIVLTLMFHMGARLVEASPNTSSHKIKM